MNDAATETYDTVWDAIADTPQEAANLKARSELMGQIAAFVRERGWTQDGKLAWGPSRAGILLAKLE